MRVLHSPGHRVEVDRDLGLEFAGELPHPVVREKVADLQVLDAAIAGREQHAFEQCGTDPQTDCEGGKQEQEQPARVYRWDPRTGALSVAADDIDGPNGLCFSPDERRLYIVETGILFADNPTRDIRVFDVDEDGSLRNGRIFHTVKPGNADGIRCDEDGNVWSSAGDGVHCIDPSGALLGKIKVPFTVANLTFGGRYRSRLFICASQTLFAIYTNQRGAQRP